MAVEANARIIERYYYELWNSWNFALADELLAPAIEFRGSLGVEVRGIEAFQGYMRLVQNAFPDFSNTMEDLVSQRNKIVARLTYRGTHRGELFGIPATGKRIAYSGSAFFHIARGKIMQGWVLGDTAGLIRQLDAPPGFDRAEAADSATRIVAATPDQREWAAALMAASEPWITLRRDLAACRRSFHRPDSLVFIALAGTEPCGFLILQRRGVADSPYIKSIGVAEAFRGQGVGTRLMRFAEDFFRPDARHMFICASSFNPRARALYERLGYSYVAELKDFVIPGASEILLHKSLGH
jgi:steroid delta-isomerase-like uncharacterized protein